MYNNMVYLYESVGSVCGCVCSHTENGVRRMDRTGYVTVCLSREIIKKERQREMGERWVKTTKWMDWWR